jgi:hypothetical protein
LRRQRQGRRRDRWLRTGSLGEYSHARWDERSPRPGRVEAWTLALIHGFEKVADAVGREAGQGGLIIAAGAVARCPDAAPGWQFPMTVDALTASLAAVSSRANESRSRRNSDWRSVAWSSPASTGCRRTAGGRREAAPSASTRATADRTRVHCYRTRASAGHELVPARAATPPGLAALPARPARGNSCPRSSGAVSMRCDRPAPLNVRRRVPRCPPRGRGPMVTSPLDSLRLAAPASSAFANF